MKRVIFLGLVGLCFVGCADRFESLYTDTTKASEKYTNVGHINKNAPIIKEPQKTQSVFEKKVEKSSTKNPDFDMVGYITSVQRDPDVQLYIYTFTDALRTNTIQFFSKEKLPYKSSELIRIYVQDNFLKSHQKYKSVTGKRTINSYIQSAKEYFIKVK